MEIFYNSDCEREEESFGQKTELESDWAEEISKLWLNPPQDDPDFGRRIIAMMQTGGDDIYFRVRAKVQVLGDPDSFKAFKEAFDMLFVSLDNRKSSEAVKD